MNQFLKELQIDTQNDIQLSVQLSEQLTWLIACGRLKPGEKLPAVRELADQLGINLHTIRSAYRKLEEINLIKTRQGVGSIILGYDLNAGSRRAMRSRTNMIGVIVPNIGGTFYQGMLQGVEEVASKHHILVTVCDTGESHKKGRDFLDMLIAKQVDGVIAGPYGLLMDDYDPKDSIKYEDGAVPIVYVDRPLEQKYSVMIDAEGAGYTATEHLIQLGHKKIAIISSRVEISSLRQNFNGFLRALSAHGIPQKEDYHIEIKAHTFQSGYQATLELLNLPDSPTAIFAVGDLVAIGCIRAIHERGLQVPDDIAVVSYNDSDAAAFTDPPLTTIDNSSYKLGVTSMELLYKLISGIGEPEEKIVLPTKLIVRKSCGSLVAKTNTGKNV